MINEDELIMLILGIAILIFLFSYRTKIMRIRSWKILITGFGFLLASWVFTIVEVFVLSDIMNFLEHLFNSLGIIVFTLWCILSVPEIKGRLENE